MRLQNAKNCSVGLLDCIFIALPASLMGLKYLKIVYYIYSECANFVNMEEVVQMIEYVVTNVI